MFLRLLLAVAIAAAPMAAAPTPARAQAAQLAKLDQLLGELAAISARATTVMDKMEALVTVFFEAVQISGKRGKAAQAAYEDWARRIDEATLVLQAEAATIPKTTPDMVTRFQNPADRQSAQALYDAYSALPNQLQKGAGELGVLKETLKSLVQRIIKGDDSARPQLVARLIGGPRLLLLCYNEVNRSSLSSVNVPRHPHKSAVRSVIAANEALIEILNVQEKVLLEEPFDVAASRAKIDRLIAEGRKQAGDISPFAAEMIVRIRRELPAGDLKDRVLAAYATFDESAALELRYFDAMARVVETIQPGMTSDTIDAWDLPGLDRIGSERNRVMAARVQMLGAQ